MTKAYITGVQKDTSQEELTQKIKETFLKSSNNLSWLKKGDKVLIKPAINSPDCYPATTHPLTLRTITEILQERGAEVIIGDQSGIEHVLQNKERNFKGSTENCFKNSGMCQDIDAKFVGFETGDWDKNFIKFKNGNTNSWQDGFYVTKWIKEVDHIINLPRISTHGQAGVTLGFKNWVGILREDSRVVFHLNGPLNMFAKENTRHAKFEIKDDKSKKFFEKIVEISEAVKEKLRLTFITGTKTQLTIGPDRYTMKLGPIKLFKAYEYEPDTGLMIASEDPLAAEISAIAYMSLLYKNVPLRSKLLQKLLVFLNGRIKQLDKENVWENPFIKHALRIGIGSKDFEIEYKDVADNLKSELNKRVGI
jgi:uncharacterized protein (DUF362 family)